MNLSVGKVLEEVRQQELHEGRRVGVDVVRAGGVEARVARRADVHHRRHVELDDLLVQRIPPAVGERRLLPVPARRIGIEVAADEPQLVDAALELGNAILGAHARRLGQLADADEVVGVERAHAADEVVAHARPLEARGFVADVVRHEARPRREERDVGAALALHPELRALEALPDLVVADDERGAGGRLARVADRGDLLLAPGLERRRRRRVVSVTVDDHRSFRVGRGLARPAAAGTDGIRRPASAVRSAARSPAPSRRSPCWRSGRGNWRAPSSRGRSARRGRRSTS